MAILEYGIGGNEVKVDTSEAIANIPENRSLIVEQLTADEPVSPLTTLTIKVLQVRHPKRNPFLRPFWVLSFYPC